MAEMNGAREYVLAFDTANEMISIALGKGVFSERDYAEVHERHVPAFRASNQKLVPEIDALCKEAGVDRSEICAVVCGRGPGSFTGVRICLSAAKGLALGLGVPLFGVSTADAQAWDAQMRGVRGSLAVVGDAMRREVYPVRYELTDTGIQRQNADIVMKAAALPEWLGSSTDRLITGDACKKYAASLEGCGVLAPADCWYPTGRGLLKAAMAPAEEGGVRDFLSCEEGNPAALLPVYTRLSDAEEHERIRFSKEGEAVAARNLETGVQGTSSPDQGQSVIRYQPLDAAWVGAVAAMEGEVMGSDAWNENQVLDELPRSDRTWWAAYAVTNPEQRVVTPETATLVGYAGGWIVDGDVQILKVASSPDYRRRGIAQELLVRVALDARDLGAKTMSLEVRASNTGAHAFYERIGLEKLGVRPRYYSDREDAFLYRGPLPQAKHDVAGMDLRVNDAASAEDEQAVLGSCQGETPRLILAIETSCDETAMAFVTEDGTIVADVVASQIDFHSRFGGVVPEIASRKHVEAIAGVAQVCLEQARERTGCAHLAWSDLLAVSVTYAPGLVGALVVGLAFAKGLAWAADVPLIGVNHLEGHLYANKIARPDIQPPMVVSLVSGGHTMLVHVKDWGSYATLGTTLDDAVGEAFDKVAKAMGLGYPGGPLITALAKKGNPKAVRFPRALMHSGDLQFSLSGLKTAVMTYLQKEEQAGRTPNYADVAASFQAAVVEVQVAKARTALIETGAKEFCLGGGVAANPELRRAYEEMCEGIGVRATLPPLSACTDNAAMIALVALDRYKQGKFFGLDCDVAAHAPLDEAY